VPDTLVVKTDMTPTATPSSSSSSSNIDQALLSSGISLPTPPAPAGSYVPVVTSGKLAFVAGQIPLEAGQVKFKGKVGRDIPIEAGQEAARLCTINGLAQLKAALGSLDRIERIVKVTGFVNCEPSFADQPKVINGASDLLVQIFGEKGRHVRAAVGVSSLPLESAVEVEFIVEIKEQ
jgi:enamine deaminase RidA (YjgF/YER057c/UK114 family)